MKKLIAIILAAVMAFSFAACGTTEPEEVVPSATPEVTDAPENSEDTGDISEEEYLEKFKNAYAKYEPSTVVMTVNGQNVTWADYYSWVYNIVAQVESYYGEVDWTTEIEEGYTYNDWVREYCQVSASQYIAIEQGAKAAGVELTEEGRAEIEKTLEDSITQYAAGDRDAFMAMLDNMFLTLDYFNYMNEVSYYYEEFFNATYGIDGSQLSDEDAIAFAEDNGYMRAKHILYKILDDAGSALDEATVAEKKAAAEGALSELRACPDLETMLTTFEEILAAEGEDPGMTNYPDGYYFTDGEMVESFENGTKALQPYELSDVIESPYGYHIILRLPLEPDSIVDAQYGVTLRTAAATNLYGDMIADLTNTAVVEYQNGFDTLNFNDLFA